jgi:hypothetical protein
MSKVSINLLQCKKPCNVKAHLNKIRERSSKTSAYFGDDNFLENWIFISEEKIGKC